MSHAPVIQVRELKKSFGRVDAVCNLNMSVAPDRITAFLGLNGAGKSTTIKMLLGMIAPSSGDGTVLGRSISDPKESVDMRRSVAYVSEQQHLYDYMTVEQMIRFTKSFYPAWHREMDSRRRCCSIHR